MGIDPHFDLWNHFIHVRLLQRSDAKGAVFGGVVIHVKSGYGVNPFSTSPCQSS
jgi:hypothetical protein